MSRYLAFSFYFFRRSFLNPENESYSSGDCLFAGEFPCGREKMRGALLLLCILPVTTNESLRESAPRGSRLFLEDGFKLLMDESLMDDPRRMYRLFSRVDSVDYIDRILRAYILANRE